jgi:hypothetical protein
MTGTTSRSNYCRDSGNRFHIHKPYFLDFPRRARPLPLVRFTGLLLLAGLGFPTFISSCGFGGM